MFQPRTKEEILQELLAGVVALSDLSDVNKGSAVSHVLGAVAEALEGFEFALRQMRDAYWFDGAGAKGELLDARLRDLPSDGLQRTAAKAAVGPALQLTRGSTDGDLVVPIGTLYARADNPRALYAQTEEVTIPDGEATYPVSGSSDSYVSIRALATGSDGNASAGAITRLVSGPSDIITVSQMQALTNGAPRADDDAARLRAFDYLSSLARAQARAIQFLALQHVDADGLGVRHARMFEDPERPGYSELVVDDGNAMASFARKSTATTGVVPTNGQAVLWFDAPMAGSLTKMKVNGATVLIGTASAPKWVAEEERGLLYVLDNTLLSPGDTWTIDGNIVYTGVIAELQRLIEGDPADLAEAAGWRATGTRVRVVAPTVQPVSFTVSMVTELAASPTAVRTAVRDTIVAFLASLGPGSPLFLAKLCGELARVEGLRNFRISSPTEDQYPATFKTVLRTSVDLISVA